MHPGWDASPLHYININKGLFQLESPVIKITFVKNQIDLKYTVCKIIASALMIIMCTLNPVWINVHS